MSLVLSEARTLRPAALPTWLVHRIPFAIVIVLALLLNRYAPGAGEYRVRVMLDIGVAIIMAVSLNIVNGFTGQFSIGHAGFFAIGGYVSATITYYGSLLIWHDAEAHGGFLGVSEWMMAGGALAGGLCAALAGWVVGLPSLRLRGDYLAIVTLGFGEIVRTILQLTNRELFDYDELREARWRDLIPPPWGGAQGFTDIPDLTNLFWVYLFVGLVLLFSYRLKQSSTGRALLSIREDEIASQAMGVNVTQLKVRAFMFGAFFAGVAGCLYAHQSGTILRPLDAGFMRSFDVIIMVVLGGMGSISGAALAAVLLTVAGEWLREPAHVWWMASWLVLTRVVFGRGNRWRDIVILGAAVALAELFAVAAGPRTAFRAWDVDVPVRDVLLAAAAIAGCVLNRSAIRSALLTVVAIAIVEYVRDFAIRRNINLGDYRMVLYALLLILMMIFRPQGLFGIRELWDLRPARRIRGVQS